MTTPPSTNEPAPQPTEAALDGHTIDELSDYLDNNCRPANPSIDNSSECQNALASLRHLRDIAHALLDDEAASEPSHDDSWIHLVLGQIAREARSGRDIPYGTQDETERLAITEGAVRGMIRAAGDRRGDILIGRCAVVGDVTAPTEPITIEVEATAFWGRNIPDAITEVRAEIYALLRMHTPLNIVAVNVTIRDLHDFISRKEPE